MPKKEEICWQRRLCKNKLQEKLDKIVDFCNHVKYLSHELVVCFCIPVQSACKRLLCGKNRNM